MQRSNDLKHKTAEHEELFQRSKTQKRKRKRKGKRKEGGKKTINDK